MIDVEKYRAKDFAVYEDGSLLAVCRYRKGATAVQSRIQDLLSRIHELEAASGATASASAAGTPCESH
jgi:hypothetical protein